jgi:Cu2+-exporting ATPase
VVTDERVFGPGGEALARRFAQRVLQFDEVRSLALDPARATAILKYRIEYGDPGDFLKRLADAVAGAGEDANETELPHWRDAQPVALSRHAGVISIRAAAPASEPVDFALANVSVGTAAVSDLALPLVMPVSAGLLVLTNLEILGAAAGQLHRREIGLPLLYTSIVGVTLASGQFLPAALMLWCFRYWEHRYRRDLRVENRALLEEVAGLPEEARVLTADGLERMVPTREVTAGQRIRALAGETVPVDGIVLSGAASVNESALYGAPAPTRKVVGDRVLGGSKLFAGALDLEVLRTGHKTRAARIAQALTAATVPPPCAWALNQEAEEFAGRAVAPTLLATGAGLLVGGVTTAGAVLRPDYATGVGLAMSLERLRHVRTAIRNGAVLRTGDAVARFAATSWIVLDDHEELHHAGCELGEIGGKWSDEVRLLPIMAAAGIWLGDERGPALARACSKRGLIVRRTELHEIGAESLTIRFGDHLVRLRGRAVAAGTVPPPLIIEVDGVVAGGVRFVRNARPEAAAVVRRLQRAGLRILLASDRASDASSSFAKRLGVDRYCGSMSADGRIRLLRELRRQSIATAYIGDCVANGLVAREADLTVGFAGADPPVEAGLGSDPPDIALLAPSIAPLPALRAMARDSAGRRQRAQSAVMGPNVLCVVGAFAFGFTPMAAVLISNFGTSLAYNGAKRALRSTALGRSEDQSTTTGRAAAARAWVRPFGHHRQQAKIRTSA